MRPLGVALAFLNAYWAIVCLLAGWVLTGSVCAFVAGGIIGSVIQDFLGANR